MLRPNVIVSILIAGMLLLLVCPSARADSVTYTYTGPMFTSYSGTYSPGIQTNVSATFTLSQPLPPNLMNNLSSDDMSYLIVSMSVTDGSFVDTNVQDVAHFVFYTDSQGNITRWYWGFIHPVDARLDVQGVESIGNWFGFGTEDLAGFANGNTGGIGSADEIGTAGTWTVSAGQTVPEPSALLMLFTSMLAIAGVARSRVAERTSRA
jgi:hypothetical protein